MKQDLYDLLTRTYLVDTFQWSPSVGALQPLDYVSFPEDLFAIPTIAAKLGTFKWLRADVHISVKINATMFHVGLLNCSTISHTANQTGALFERSFRSVSQRLNAENQEFLDCAKINSIELDLVRNAPLLMFSTDDPEDGDVGVCEIDIICPLEISDGASLPPELTVSVFASFVNPEVIGYGYAGASPQHAKDVVRESIKHGAWKYKSRPERAVRTKWPRRLMTRHELDSDEYLDEIVFEKQSGDAVGAEANSKSKAGVLSGIAEAVRSFAPKIRSSPFSDAVSGIAKTVSDFGPFLAGLGFSKPTSNAATQPVVQESSRDWMLGHGLDMSTKMSLRPDAKLGETTFCDCRPHPIREMVMKPGFVGQFKIPYNAVVDTPLKSFQVSPGLCYKEIVTTDAYYTPTPLAYISQMFANWRGGMKLYFKFTTAAVVTARVRVSIFPSDDFPTSIERTAGDNVTAVLDLRGSGELCIPVPYQGRQGYKQVTGYYGLEDTTNVIPIAEDDCWCVISLSNIVTNPSVAGVAGIYVNIFAAAAEDMNFQNFIGHANRLTGTHVPSDDVIEEKQALSRVFSKPFPPLSGAKASIEAGLYTSEHYSTLEELTHRMEQVPVLAPASGFSNNLMMWNGTSFEADTSDDTLTYLSYMFGYYRGGLRYKIVTPTSVITDPPTIPPNDYNKEYLVQLYYGSYPGQVEYVNTYQATKLLVWEQASIRGALCFEIPWVANVPVRPTFDDNFDDYGNQEWITYSESMYYWLSRPIQTLYRGSSDDFQFGYYVPPPQLIVEIPPPLGRKKQKGKEKEVQSLAIMPKTNATSLEQSETTQQFVELNKQAMLDLQQRNEHWTGKLQKALSIRK